MREDTIGHHGLSDILWQGADERTRVNNDEALISEGHELPSGRVADLVDSLSPEDPEA
jgi:hypothetical protein